MINVKVDFSPLKPTLEKVKASKAFEFYSIVVAFILTICVLTFVVIVFASLLIGPACLAYMYSWYWTFLYFITLPAIYSFNHE